MTLTSGVRMPVDSAPTSVREGLNATLQLTRKALRVSATTKELVLSDNLCWLCGCKAELIDAVIPLPVGGLSIVSNLAPSCRNCARKRGGLDLTEDTDRARQVLNPTALVRRLHALTAAALHHPIPLTHRSSKASSLAYLKKRWDIPRVGFAMAYHEQFVYLAVLQDKPGPYTGAALFTLRNAGADQLDKGQWRINSSSFSDLMGPMIDRHVLFFGPTAPPLLHGLSGVARRNAVVDLQARSLAHAASE